MRTTRSRRRRRTALALLTVLGLVAVVSTASAYYLGRRLVAPIERIDGVFAGLEDRPSKPTTGPAAKAINILLLGTDRRSDEPTTGDLARAAAWVPGAQRSDAMLLVHIDGDREGATVVSLPRDSWVEVPGHGHTKINAAYSYGGPSLAVATVEELTGVRIDHLAVIDWDGIRALTDELGGVTVTVPETVHDSARDVTWTAGEHRLTGQAALDYVGQRFGLPGGDLDRASRQQNFLRTLMVDTLGRLQDSGPWGVYELLGVMTRHLSIDSGWSTKDMARLAWSLRDLDESAVSFLTVPVAGLGWEGPQSVVHLDLVAGRRLWEAVRADRLAPWLRANPQARLGETVR
ncbi:LCP family protein [Nocardioides sp. cx-173]|uniref:LCP family protein n=1 Tax=Nocardioides sp. cx-173 TaxID=2898796 RepID=UPI001E4B6365|nr:LCP family protein [Nocardioides sp. cx-173]MCD4526679.1 LCP family protein [Nocardioides sp. cx-173]UGB42578.1 LCP family protein [Nocardioides sp. cx-173]